MTKAEKIIEASQVALGRAGVVAESAMKAAMEDWLEALPKPAVKEFFGVQKKFPNPKDKKTVDAKNLEILKKYKIKPLIGDPSHRESLSALSCCLDMLVGGQGESVKVEGDSIEEVMGEANQLNELQTIKREQEQIKELQKLQTIAREKAKAWDTRSTNPKSEAQEAAFDAAVDKLSAEMRDAENERRTKEVIDKDGKVMKKPSAALLKQLAPQREAQLKRDASDYNDWVGTAQFDRDSSKASIIIDEIKKGLSRAKTTKKESVTTKGYTELLEVALITLCNKYELDLKTLLVELQTPERRDELDRLYWKAENKFMRNISSDALMNALNAIDDKSHKEALSKSTYGKGGKIVKRAK
jgi:hypothetical protein